MGLDYVDELRKLRSWIESYVPKVYPRVGKTSTCPTGDLYTSFSNGVQTYPGQDNTPFTTKSFEEAIAATKRSIESYLEIPSILSPSEMEKCTLYWREFPQCSVYPSTGGNLHWFTFMRLVISRRPILKGYVDAI